MANARVTVKVEALIDLEIPQDLANRMTKSDLVETINECMNVPLLTVDVSADDGKSLLADEGRCRITTLFRPLPESDIELRDMLSGDFPLIPQEQWH